MASSAMDQIAAYFGYGGGSSDSQPSSPSSGNNSAKSQIEAFFGYQSGNSSGNGNQGQQDAVDKAGQSINAQDTRGRGNRSYLREAVQDRQNQNPVTWENFQSKLQQAQDQYTNYFNTFQNHYGVRQDLTEDDQRRLDRAGITLYNNKDFGNSLEDWKTYGEGQERQIKAQTADLRKFMDDNAEMLNQDAAKEIRDVLDQMDDYSGQLWRAAYNDEGIRARDNFKQTGKAYTVAEKAYNEAQQKLQDVIQNTSSDVDYDKAVEAARNEAKAAEDALRKARSAYEAAGGLGRSYSNEDRVSDTVKGAMASSSASTVDAFRALWEKGEGQRYANDLPRMQALAESVRRADEEYAMALEAAGGNESDPAVQAARQRRDDAKAFADRYSGIVTADQGLAEKAAGTADRLAEASAMDISRAKNGASDVTQFLVDAGVAGTQLATDAAISAMTGIPTMALIGIRSFGGGTQQARQGGGTIDQQLAYGAANAAVEMLTEKMADGLAGIAGKGAADDVAEQVIRKLAQTDAGRTALRAVYGMMGEGAEEFVSSALDPALRSIYDGNTALENYSNEDISDWLYDALVGAALAVPGAAGSIATGQNAAKNADLRAQDAMDRSGLTGPASQAQNAMDVLSGRYTPEQMAQRESAAQTTLAENMGGTDALSQYINDQRLGNYQNVQAAEQTTPMQQLARQAVAEVLANGRVNNTTVNEILNNQELRAAAEYQTGLPFDGMTTEQARSALQRAARQGAYTTAQFNAQEARAAESENARAQAALEEEAVRNNDSNYDSYIRGVLRTGADTQTANEILNDENLIRIWENLAQKQLPRDKSGKIIPKSALKMLRQTTRANVDIDVDSAIERYIAERNAPPQTAENAPQTQDVSTGEITQAETQTGATEASQELNSNPTPTAETQTAETVTAPTAETPAETARPAAPAPAPTAQTQTGDVTLTPTETTTAESTNGRGRERERGGSQNIRTNENAEQPLRQEFENVPDTYRQLTNKETQAAADDILAKGFDSALTEVTEAIGRAKAGMKLSPAHFVAGFQVANELTRRGNVQQAREIMSDLIAEQTAAGQLGQVGRLVRQAISDSDPATRAMAVQKLIGKLNQQLTNGQMRTNMRRGLGDESGRISVSEALINNYANAPNPEAADAAMEAIQEDIAAQMPATLRDKFTALRYLNMLGNFKTQFRNIVGNTLMMAATDAKRATQSVAEMMAYVATGGNYERTTSLFTNRGLLNQANDVFDENVDDIKGESRYSDVAKQAARDIQDKRTIFGSGQNLFSFQLGGKDVEVRKNVLENARRLTNWAMDAGDVIFMRHTFNRAYAGWMQAHGVTDISTATAEQKASAYDFAKQEAQEATFHDSNAVSDWVSRIGRGENTPAAVRTLSEGIMPFRKTPANVAVRAIEYSPLGIAETIYKAYQKGKGNATSADVINSLSKNATGTALAVAGYVLAAMGQARGSGDDEDKDLDYFRQMRGESDYSVKIGDSYVSLSQFAPMAIPFFMGVKLQELMEYSDEPFSMENVGDILGIVTDPMLEMSMLSGVNDTLSKIASLDGSTDAIPSLVTNSAISFLSQALTNSLVGQFEQAQEENRQTTYSDTRSEDATAFDRLIGSQGQQTLGKLSAKTPGLDYHQEDYIDAWGRTQSNGGTGIRYFNALLNPTYLTGDRSTDVDNELERLHTANSDVEGFPEVLPKKRSRNATIGDGIVMTPDEYRQFSIESGQAKLNLVRDFINSKQYKGMSDAERAKTIQDLYSFADDRALQKIKQGYGINKASDWDDEAQLRNPAEYLAAKAVLRAGEPDYSHMDDVFRNWGSYSSDTQDALKKLSGVNNMRFAYDQLGMSTEEYNKVKSDVAKYEAEGLEGETKGAADAAVISKHYKGTDAEKLAALESQNLPDKQTGKRAAIVRRFEAAQERGIPFDTWAKIEGYIQDNAKNPGSPNNAILYEAANAFGYDSWIGKYVWRKDSSDEDYVTLFNDYFSQDYVPKERADYGAYFGTSTAQAQPETPQQKPYNAADALAGFFGYN